MAVAVIINVNGLDSVNGLPDPDAEDDVGGAWDPGGSGSNSDYFPAIYSEDFSPGGTLGFFFGHWPDGTGGKYSAIKVNRGLIGSWDINPIYLARDTGTPATSAGMAPDDWPFWSGETYTGRAGAPFRVNIDGSLFATGVTISGAITATSGSIEGTLTVGTDGNKITIIGTASDLTTAIYSKVGNYGNADTPFYMDASGRFSMGADLTWSGSVLTLAGDLTLSGKLNANGALFGSNVSGSDDGIYLTTTNYAFATGAFKWGGSTGFITGTGTDIDIVAANFNLQAGGLELSSVGYIVLGTGNDILRGDATDATYRLWIGNATAASAPFRVAKDGAMVAADGGAVFEADGSGTLGTNGIAWTTGGVVTAAGWTLSTDKFVSATGAVPHLELNKTLQRISTMSDLTTYTTVQGYLAALPHGTAHGTATSGTTTTLTDTTPDGVGHFPVDDAGIGMLKDLDINITAGAASGNTRTIESNTATTITVPSGAPFSVAIDNTSVYNVTYTVADYGFWAKQGDRIRIDGEVQSQGGDWLIGHDSSFRILNGLGNTIIRMGTDTGEKGLFIYDSTGANIEAKFINSKMQIGRDSGTARMTWNTDIANQLAIFAQDGTTEVFSTLADGARIGGPTGWEITTNTIKGLDAASVINLNAGDLVSASGTGKRIVIDGGENSMVFYDASGEVVRIDDNAWGGIPGMLITDGIIRLEGDPGNALTITENQFILFGDFISPVPLVTMKIQDNTDSGSVDAVFVQYQNDDVDINGVYRAAFRAQARVTHVTSTSTPIGIIGSANASNPSSGGIGGYFTAGAIISPPLSGIWAGYFDAGDVFINQRLVLGTAGTSTADGTIRFNSGNLEGREGGAWVSLTAGGGGATNLASLTDVTLTAPVDGDLFIFDSAVGGGDWVDVPMSGDASITKAGVITISTNAVSNGKLANMAGHSVKVRVGSSTSDPSDLVLGENVVLGRVTSNIIGIARAGIDTDSATHIANSGNPHTVTLAQVGALSNATNSTQDGYFSGVRLWEGSNYLRIIQLNDSADDNHTLSIDVVNSSRTLTMIGSATISGTHSGTNTGDQTITLTGDIVGSGTGSFDTQIQANKVGLAELLQVSAHQVLARLAGTSGNLSQLTIGANTVLGRGSAGNIFAVSRSGVDTRSTFPPATHAFSVHTGVVSVSDGGTGLTSGYNKTNWDTAFAWGDHSAEIDSDISTHTAISSAHHAKYLLTNDLSPGEIIQLQNIGAATISAAQWSHLGVVSGSLAIIGGAHHDGFSDFVANEHKDHTTISVSAGVGLSGGGTIAATRTLTLNLNGLGIETDMAAVDFIAMVDFTDSGSQKITLSNFALAIDSILNLANIGGTLDVASGGTGLTSGYNKTNWDTAFAWGDHSAEIDSDISTHTAISSAHHAKYLLTNDLSPGEIIQLQNIGAATISAGQWDILGGLAGTLSAAELNHVDGVTSAIQTQLNGKAVSGGAEHDGFSDFVINEHINHGSVSVIAGAGLTGGGTIVSTKTLNVIAGTGITVNANDVKTNDGQIVHDNLSGFVANEHINHANVSVLAGAGLTGGGTIAATRSIHIGAGTGIDVGADSIAVDVSDFMANGSNNRVLTATGTDAMRAETGLTFDGTTLIVTGNITVANISPSGTVDGVDIAARDHAKYTNGEAISAVQGEATLALSGAITSVDSIASAGLIAGATITGINVTSGADPGHTHSSLIEAGGKTLKVKVLEIGDWNMDTASFKDVTHGLGASWSNVCAIRAIIINDAATVMIDINLSSLSNGTATGYGSVAYATSTVIQLRRITGGGFDNTSYNSTSLNRGFITIWYF